jgi:serine/threonine protein kinase/tetratricopeptide (TPR) repeat protein
MSLDPKLVQAVFLAAVDCEERCQRAAVLEQQCGDNRELRERVEELLKAHDAPDDLPHARLTGWAATTDHTPAYPPGTMIAGRYKLLEEIAEGGMGTVWVAQQTEPVRRRVALKLIKPGMDSRRVLSRFEAERQALALMDHPNIAKVFDGGVTDQGHPFFVMEYVKGLPITDYCDQARLALEERLRLFVQVCEATQHAHQKGIIHRDLKPSNVLVCRYDDRAVPKVIDFGLAKAMHEPLTEDTIHSAHGVMMGTPRYMSPEQAEFNNLDIDTRSDVFSLGVILYELLTGTTPLEGKRFKDASWQEILRLIKEEEPTRPSTKLSSSGTLPSIAEQRSLEAAQLCRAVRDDLDWIVMKALEKDRSRRYKTVSDLARDIERYLRDEPVEARPPSASYRFRKFARRNRVAITTAMLVLAALVAGTVVSTTQAIRAMRAERVAEAERSEAEKQRAVAEANFQNARKAVDDYFTSVSQAKLLNVPGLQPLRKELLDSALAYYRQFIDQYGDDPTVQAELAASFVRVGSITSAIGSKEQALAAFHEATDVYERLVRDHPAGVDYQVGLASAFGYVGDVQHTMGRLADAEESFRRALAIREKLVRENSDDGDYRAHLSGAYCNLGTLQSAIQRLDDAKVSFQRALEISEKLVAEDPTVNEYQNGLALVCYEIGTLERRAGRLSDSEAPYKRALEIREKLARENPGVSEYLVGLAGAYNNVSVAQREMGRLPDTEALFNRALEVYEKLARENPSVNEYRASAANAHNQIGLVHRLLGRNTDSEASYHRSLEMYEKLAREYPGVAHYRVGIGTVYFNLGILQSVAGQKDAAAQSWAAAAKTYAATADLGHATPEVFSGLGDALAMLGQWKEAADAFGRTVDLTDHAWKPAFQLAVLQWAAGDVAGYRASCADLVSRHGDKTGVAEGVAIAMACMAGERAVDNLDDVLAIVQRTAATNPHNPVFQTLVGAAQFRAGQTQEAIRTLQKSLPMHASAALAAPRQLDLIHISRLTGESILTQAYHEARDEQALAKQLDVLRGLVEQLASTTPQYSEGLGQWALPLTILSAKRDLARLDADRSQ